MGTEASKLPDGMKNSYLLPSKEEEQRNNRQESVDSRFPLTVRQTFKLKKSWKGVRRDMRAAGLEMFIRFVILKRNQYLTEKRKSFHKVTSDSNCNYVVGKK